MRILKFETPCCGMCSAMDISLKKLHINVEHIDATENEELRDKYKVMNVPTLVMVDDDGKFIKRTGYIGMLELREWVKC